MSDLPESAPLSDAGGQGAAAEVTPFAEAQTQPPPPHQPDQRHYRVREWSIDGSVRTFSHVYDWLQDAIDVADRLCDIEARHRRPSKAVVFDVWTGEIMATRRPDEPVDDTLCPTCGQTRDPFAKAWTQAELEAEQATELPDTFGDGLP